MILFTGGGLCPGGSLSRGVSVQVGVCLGGLCHEEPPRTAEERNGIHSCLRGVFIVVRIYPCTWSFVLTITIKSVLPHFRPLLLTIWL